MSLPWSEERTPDDSSSFPDPCQHSLKGVIVYTEKRAICSLRLYTRSEGQKATQEAWGFHTDSSFLILFSCRIQVSPKIMNLSSEHCSTSDWLRLEATVKASVCVVDFSFATCHHYHNRVTEFKTEERGPIHPPLPPSAVHVILWSGGGFPRDAGPPGQQPRAGWCLGHSEVLEKEFSSLWACWLSTPT